MTMYRQGDVLFRQVQKLPKKIKLIEPDSGRVVLAYGEVTGHSHAFGRGSKVCLFRDDGAGGTRYLEVTEAADLQHEEHGTITVPPGIYQIPQQREYAPEDIRVVAD